MHKIDSNFTLGENQQLFLEKIILLPGLQISDLSRNLCQYTSQNTCQAWSKHLLVNAGQTSQKSGIQGWSTQPGETGLQSNIGPTVNCGQPYGLQ